MIRFILLAAAAVFVAGCRDGSSGAPTSAAKLASAARAPTVDPAIAEELAKRAPEDRKLAEAQKTCPVTGELLGSMGVPIKLVLKGEPVFLCCSSCKKKAEENPDKTLTAAAEAKAKAKEPKK